INVIGVIFPVTLEELPLSQDEDGKRQNLRTENGSDWLSCYGGSLGSETSPNVTI
ncbi:hypothetical protein HAX54_009870, partial [Datura stramonium]|nr:hypothetical protein [Datura stramonium]